MSELANPLPAPIQSLLDDWAAGLARVLESMTDQKADVRWASGAPPSGDTELLWWEQPFQLSPEAVVWIAAPRSTWEHAGTITLKAAGLDTVEVAEARNTWLEILGQSLSRISDCIGETVGREVSCGPGSERAPAVPPEAGVSVSIQLPGTELLQLWIGFSDGLVSIVSSFGSDSGSEAKQQVSIPDGPVEAATHRAAMPPNMDLLLDVELAVSISFGKADLAMKDVLKLTTGSIVELNRGVNDPVEVMVNNCLIARGEVVVVEGNYGVRIQQIASKADRLRSLQ